MQSRLETVLHWIGIPIVAAVGLLPGLHVGPSLDAAVFGLVGRQLVDGATLYVDTWDHKPPGIYVVHALTDALPLLGQWEWTWLLTLASISATCWVLVAMLRPLVSARVAIGIGLLSALGMSHFILSLGGGLSESFATLPATLALALAHRRAGHASAALAGALVAVAVLLSPQLAASGVAVLLPVARRSIAAAGTYLVAAALPVGILLAAIAWIGALPAFRDAVVAYNVAYSASGGPGFALLPWTVLSLIPLIAPALIGAVAVRRSSVSLRRLGFASLAWMAVAILLVALQGRLYGHYATGMVVPLAILAAIGAEDVRTRMLSPRPRLVARAAGAGLVVLSLAIGAAGGRWEIAGIQEVNARGSAVADWAEREELTGEPMLVWGNAPQVYLAIDSPPALPYAYLYPLTTPGYATDGLIADALAALEDEPPEMVIDAGSSAPGQPGFPPLLIERPVVTDGRDLDVLDPLRAFVADRYELVATVSGWPVYRLVGGGPSD